MNSRCATGVAAALATALLLAMSFAPWSLPLAGWLGLIPLALFLRQRCGVSWAGALGIGMTAGTAFGWSVFHWMHHVTWLGLLLLGLYTGCYFAIWSVCWWVLNRRASREECLSEWIWICGSGASAWVLLEWVRSWLFTGFGWNSIGSSQAGWPAMAQVVDLGGPLLLSWVVVFAGLLASCLLRGVNHPERKSCLLYGVLILAAMPATALLYGWWQIRSLEAAAPSSTMKVLAIQPDIPQDPWKRAPTNQTLLTLSELTETGLDAAASRDFSPDLILWPETPIAASVFENPIYRELVESYNQRAGGGLILGSVDFLGPRLHNSAGLFQGRGTPQVYYKRHLVPFGEYIPLATTFPWIRQYIPVAHDFSPGDKTGLFTLNAKGKALLRMGILICFEDTVPWTVRKTAQARPDVIVNLTNDGWFRESSAAMQHFQNARLHAIAYRTPMVRCTNNGVTAILSRTGKALQTLRSGKTGSIHEKGFLLGEIPIHPPSPTLYLLWGDWIVWGSLIWVALATGDRAIRLNPSPPPPAG